MAKCFVFILENYQTRPDGGMHGPTYRNVYVVAAPTEKKAKEAAVERSAGWKGWDSPFTKCRKVGVADATSTTVLEPSPKDIGIY